MGEKVEVVQNRVSLWQAYKQGVGVGLGVLTVYVLALALLAVLATKALTPSDLAPQPEPKEGRTCSNSWV
jgi:hypothetical protein